MQTTFWNCSWKTKLADDQEDGNTNEENIPDVRGAAIRFLRLSTHTEKIKRD